MDKLPLVKKKTVYHVGTMDISKKRENSMEGSGLSVSTCPDAWVEINDFTCGDTFELKKVDCSFLNFYNLTKKQRKAMADWGIENGYILPKKLYRVFIYVEDWDEEGYTDYEDFETAQLEADYSEGRIEEVDGYIATKKMTEEVRGNVSPQEVISLLSTIYAEKVLSLDGVWWNENLDPSILSAPRGVIFNSKVSEWSVKNLSL